ncbi:Mitochondrial carrier protein [Coccidioides posadasii C735 delta SOWgp]|uniref:Mitochondrial carrier protein n=1 Tax=Coccidioides posadasii (strain C735) TaxID=222929 RepID=C5PBS3_COCP7|nr:Mitochondrial carrier protein [Coccidioides posadasii C735 delta SOWgp]EER25400.1 Mitochondrial carrier protein [Coccidioides posadasii C735 delta SOWgp]|eukprot:XP_003067545.1 Mitochondrial carrier protein [Coccidioides posadasii C735 delta SOWgp]
MSLVSRVTNLFGKTTADSSTQTSSSSPSSVPPSGSGALGYDLLAPAGDSHVRYDAVQFEDSRRAKRLRTEERREEYEENEQEYRPPYLHSMLAGGIGGTSGDMLMHSLDTVKTRQQGDPHVPPKYTSMSSSYTTIFRQEGVRRGLYSGVTPALLGSFPGTVIFFGTYEYSKRHMLDAGINPSLAYLAGGFIADLAASFVYVPSEVLKTRLQLQGRYNNPFFKSGYNYRSTLDAFRTIIKEEGFFALYSGFKATLFRDLPFSALQFAFYEQEQKFAKECVGSRDIGLPLEILTATSAGGMAGVITCPLDVVKTRIQTQHSDSLSHHSKPSITDVKAAFQESSKHVHSSSTPSSSASHTHQSRLISTSSPSTSTVKPGALILDTSSVVTGLRLIYKTEGFLGWFRGVGPRFLWTSVQSGTMLVLYQFLLKHMESYWGVRELSSASSI